MKIKKLNARGFSHDVLVVLFIVVFAIVGVGVVVASHADPQNPDLPSYCPLQVDNTGKSPVANTLTPINDYYSYKLDGKLIADHYLTLVRQDNHAVYLGYCFQNVEGFAFPNAMPVAANEAGNGFIKAEPLFAYWNPGYKKHFYSSTGQVLAGDGSGYLPDNPNYTDIWISPYGPDGDGHGHFKVPGTMPLYEMLNSSTKGHYYTVDPNQIVQAKNAGYVMETLVGYVWSSAKAYVAPTLPTKTIYSGGSPITGTAHSGTSSGSTNNSGGSGLTGSGGQANNGGGQTIAGNGNGKTSGSDSSGSSKDPFSDNKGGRPFGITIKCGLADLANKITFGLVPKSNNANCNAGSSNPHWQTIATVTPSQLHDSQGVSIKVYACKFVNAGNNTVTVKVHFNASSIQKNKNIGYYDYAGSIWDSPGAGNSGSRQDTSHGLTPGKSGGNDLSVQESLGQNNYMHFIVGYQQGSRGYPWISLYGHHALDLSNCPQNLSGSGTF